MDTQAPSHRSAGWLRRASRFAPGVIAVALLAASAPSALADDTSTTLTSSGASVWGEEVTFTATVTDTTTAATVPTGSIQFSVDGVDVPSPPELTGGTATFSTRALEV